MGLALAAQLKLGVQVVVRRPLNQVGVCPRGLDGMRERTSESAALSGLHPPPRKCGRRDDNARAEGEAILFSVDIIISPSSEMRACRSFSRGQSGARGRIGTFSLLDKNAVALDAQ
jgi:hypothetical protein